MIASITRARPALIPSPTSSISIACRTVAPRPGAEISAAITTIDSAAITVWFTPSTIVRRAIGSSTLARDCSRVEPSDCEASTAAVGTERMPCAVSRITGGIA